MAVEVVGGDVEQHRDLADETEGQVDLEARQFEDVDAALGERLLRQNGEPDVAAEARGDARRCEDVVDQRGGRRLAVGAGDADDAVRRQFGPRQREQLDVTHDGHVEVLCGNDQRCGVRNAGRDDERVEFGQIGRGQIDERPGKCRARRRAVVPRAHRRAARGQRCRDRTTRACEAVDAVGPPREGARRDHRSFNVARPASASTIETIQNRMTTVDSLQPRCSK